MTSGGVVSACSEDTDKDKVRVGRRLSHLRVIPAGPEGMWDAGPRAADSRRQPEGTVAASSAWGVGESPARACMQGCRCPPGPTGQAPPLGSGVGVCERLHCMSCFARMFTV